MKMISEPEREIKVMKEADVVVVGGGPAPDGSSGNWRPGWADMKPSLAAAAVRRYTVPVRDEPVEVRPQQEQLFGLATRTRGVGVEPVGALEG
jgi:hypothetical protein